jgi:hypothetical protein
MFVELLENNADGTYYPKIIAAYPTPVEDKQTFLCNLRDMFPNVPLYYLKESAEVGKFIMRYDDIQKCSKEQNLCDDVNSITPTSMSNICNSLNNMNLN